MEFYICDMTENDAIVLSNWKYDNEFEVYNYPDWSVMKAQKWAIVDAQKRRNQFKKIIDKDKNFIGYFRVQLVDGNNILGLGMNPVFCSRGLGKDFVKKILSYIFTNNHNDVLLEVRDFNERAIKCYLKCGFDIVNKINKTTLMGNDNFVVMKLTYHKFADLFIN